MPTVYMGIGVPGAGKTTYWKKFLTDHRAVYVCPDEIREELYGDYRFRDDSQHPVVWEKAFDQVQAALASGQDVIVDGASIGVKHRREDIAKYRGWGADKIIGYWFKTPLELSEQRNRERDKAIPEGVIPTVYARLEQQPPELADGFDEIVVITDADTAPTV
jgi:predicted kinase